MGLSYDTSNKIFFVLGAIFQLWFIIIYAIQYQYIFYPTGSASNENAYSFLTNQGFLIVVFLVLLFFLGFTVVNTYVGGAAYSTAIFSFMILVFTIQYYFIIRSFWIGIGLGNDNYTYTLGYGANFNLIRLASTDYRLTAVNGSYNTNVGMTEAIVCAMSMIVAYMALAGRIQGFHIFVLCFFGVFFYGFNEIIIWRHAIADNGYTLRLFLFGSSFGLTTGLVLRFKDKLVTAASGGYIATRHTRAYALIGACFFFLLNPILYAVGQVYDPAAAGGGIITYLFPAVLNSWFALSASASTSYCISILLGRKIHPHDIVFSSFTGGIAYAATSTLNSDPFPAILCGLIAGFITTILNHKLKKPLNNPEVVDTQGTLFTFFTASLFGGIYSAILAAVFPWGPNMATASNSYNEVQRLEWLPYGRSKISQGGMQLAGTFISIAVGILSSVAVSIILYLTVDLTAEQAFNDAVLAQVCDPEDVAPAGTAA